MKRLSWFLSMVLLMVGTAGSQALDPEQWPSTTDFSEEVHYWSADGFLASSIPAGQGTNFYESLQILTGGDQATEDVTIGGKAAKKATTTYFNVADEFFFIWPDYVQVDVLVLYFANSESKRDNAGFLLGQLGNLHGVGGYTYEAITDNWQWRLFRLDNSGMWLGDQVDPSVAGSQFGGVNGGTLRFERVNNIIYRAIAIAPAGTFGEPEEINVSGGGDEFDPDLYQILAEWDLNRNVANGIDLYIVTGGDQEVVISENIGPANDSRKAARPAKGDGSDGTEDNYMNWEIQNEHFGPTSQPGFRMKIVAEYFDDPALAGTVFGPEAYKTAGNELAFFPEDRRTTLQGTGRWMEAEWYVPDVKLFGVNVPTQAGPRFHFDGPVYISRLRVGAIRTAGMYENVDPIPDSYPFDPDPYGIYAELDLHNEIRNHLDMGNNGGDQEYIIEDNIGPAGDKRTAVRPALDQGSGPFDRFMNFAILDEVFGPSNQPNAMLKVAVDYYDNPDLVGAQFGPEVYQTSVYGNLQHKFNPPSQYLSLEGTDTWRTVAWVIPDVNFTGVNVGPQGAVRFWFGDNAPVHISRVRYAVIRPQGINAGVDMLADIPATDVLDWDLH